MHASACHTLIAQQHHYFDDRSNHFRQTQKKKNTNTNTNLSTQFRLFGQALAKRLRRDQCLEALHDTRRRVATRRRLLKRDASARRQTIARRRQLRGARLSLQRRECAYECDRSRLELRRRGVERERGGARRRQSAVALEIDSLRVALRDLQRDDGASFVRLASHHVVALHERALRRLDNAQLALELRNALLRLELGEPMRFESDLGGLKSARHIVAAMFLARTRLLLACALAVAMACSRTNRS